MRSILENNRITEPFLAQGLRYGTEKLTITGAFTLSSAYPSPPIIGLDGTSSSYNVNLPPIVGATMPMEGRWQRIVNISTGAGTLVVKSDAADGGSTLATLAQNEIADFFVVNSAWVTDYVPSGTGLSYLSGVTPGTTTASKALVVDSNKRLDVLTLGTLSLGAGAGTAVTATAAEINVLHSVTAGTAAASSAVVLDSGTKITGLLQAGFGAGTATVAPITLTAGTNLTTAAAGSLEFDGKVYYATAVNSARQVWLGEQFCCLTTDYTATDSSAAQKVFNASANGTITLTGTTTYFFEGLYKIANTGTTSHTWGVLFGGGATLTGIFFNAMARTGTTGQNTITALSDLQIAVASVVAVTAASTSASEFVTIMLKGFVEVNAGGTFIPQIQASAQPGLSGTPGVLVKAGSYFRIWPVGTNAVSNVGNWS